MTTTNSQNLKSNNLNQNVHTPFETFLLASTPFVTHLLESDTLVSIFSNLENFSDLGIEVNYTDEDGSKCLDVYLPTLKGIALSYRPDLMNPAFETINYTEEEPFYNRVPFIDKIQELE